MLRMDEKMSERNRKNIKEYGLKFQKKKGTDTHYYIYIIKQDVKYYLNIDRNVNKLGFSKNSKTEWIVNPVPRSNYLFRIVDNKTGDLFLNVDANGLQVTTNSQPLYLYLQCQKKRIRKWSSFIFFFHTVHPCNFQLCTILFYRCNFIKLSTIIYARKF